MDLWYTEPHTKNVKLSIKVDRHLACCQSEYQRIDIFSTKEFGRILTLDGLLMVTEKDEFIYHEMITHVPMAVNPSINHVLVIGAGDGGTVRELCRYGHVEHIDLVEIDSKVVELCREFMPQTAAALSDSRVDIFYEDGLRFVRSKKDCYQLIIVDSTDPFGPGEGLFTKEFYGNCYNALKEDGILINQHESVFYSSYADQVSRAHGRISWLFPICKVYQAHIPTYPSGHWLFGYAAKKHHPIKDLKAEYWNALGLPTRYYNTDLHQGCFQLPVYVKEFLK